MTLFEGHIQSRTGGGLREAAERQSYVLGCWFSPHFLTLWESKSASVWVESAAGEEVCLCCWLGHCPYPARCKHCVSKTHQTVNLEITNGKWRGGRPRTLETPPWPLWCGWQFIDSGEELRWASGVAVGWGGICIHGEKPHLFSIMFSLRAIYSAWTVPSLVLGILGRGPTFSHSAKFY